MSFEKKKEDAKKHPLELIECFLDFFIKALPTERYILVFRTTFYLSTIGHYTSFVVHTSFVFASRIHIKSAEETATSSASLKESAVAFIILLLILFP